MSTPLEPQGWITCIAPSWRLVTSSKGCSACRLDRPTALVTFHPVTAEPGRAAEQVEALTAALLEATPLQAVITMANADAEGRAINERRAAFCRDHADRFQLVHNLGTRHYLGCLRNLDLMVGNSSNGLIEAPSFAVPVVNVGERQRGRIRADNVIEVDADASGIRAGIDAALSGEFRWGLKGMVNPYDPFGDGRISERIVEVVRRFLREPQQVGKAFTDQPTTPEGAPDS